MNDSRPTTTGETDEQEWGDFKMGTAQEETAKNSWVPFAADTYVAKLVDLKKILKKGYMTEEYEFTFKLLNTVEGNEVLNADNKPVTKDLVTIWALPSQSGMNKKTGQPLKLRAILVALLNIGVSSAIPSGFKPKDVLGNKIKMTCDVGLKDDGSRSNKWLTYAPYRGQQQLPAGAVSTSVMPPVTAVAPIEPPITGPNEQSSV